MRKEMDQNKQNRQSIVIQVQNPETLKPKEENGYPKKEVNTVTVLGFEQRG